MAALFASGLIFDGILALTVLETLYLLWRGRTDLLATLLAGIFLLTTLCLLAAGAGWTWLALALLAAFAAHLADLAKRWR